jgi:hypothetical protein
MGDRKEPLSLDELLIGAANPLGPDADGDGFLDDFERQLGFNPTADDRDGDLDGNGISNLQQAVDTFSSPAGKPLLAVMAAPVALTLSQQAPMDWKRRKR